MADKRCLRCSPDGRSLAEKQKGEGEGGGRASSWTAAPRSGRGREAREEEDLMGEGWCPSAPRSRSPVNIWSGEAGREIRLPPPPLTPPPLPPRVASSGRDTNFVPLFKGGLLGAKFLLIVFVQIFICEV